MIAPIAIVPHQSHLGPCPNPTIYSYVSLPPEFRIRTNQPDGFGVRVGDHRSVLRSAG